MHQYSYRLWTDHARVLASLRQRTWSDAQLHTLDQVARALADMYGEDNRTFDRAWFGDLCKAGTGYTRITLQPIHQEEQP